MKPNSINITYKSRKHSLNRVNTEGKYFQIGFETDRWQIHISLQQDNRIRLIINKSVKISPYDYHTQFCYDCYCYLNSDHLFLCHVSDPATCKRVYNNVRWFTIEPLLAEIYAQLKEELEELHPFDLITHSFKHYENHI